jgi:hypothetical protein
MIPNTTANLQDAITDITARLRDVIKDACDQDNAMVVLHLATALEKTQLVVLYLKRQQEISSG